MFPDKASLYICGIEDRQYKEEKIYCKLNYLVLFINVSLKTQGLVVRKMDSVIQRIAMFSNFLKLFIYWYKPD